MRGPAHIAAGSRWPATYRRLRATQNDGADHAEANADPAIWCVCRFRSVGSWGRVCPVGGDSLVGACPVVFGGVGADQTTGGVVGRVRLRLGGVTVWGPRLGGDRRMFDGGSGKHRG